MVDPVDAGGAWVVVIVALTESATAGARVGAAVVVGGPVVSGCTWAVDASPDAALAVVAGVGVGVAALAMVVGAVVLVVTGVENALTLGVTLMVVRDVAGTYERDAHS